MSAQTISLRSATPGDTAGIDQVLSETYPRILKDCYRPSVMVMAVPLISRANPTLIRSGTYYVAEDPEGMILGAGGWTRHAERDDVGEVRHLVTHWRHLRSGIGRRLILGVFAEAALDGVRRLDCQATLNAVPFYRAMGFEERTRVTVPLRPGIEFPVMLMQRYL